MKLDLTDLTPGEELWLWRRRQVSPWGRTRSRIGSGMSQEEAAARFGMTLQRYHDAEADRLAERDIRTILAEIGVQREMTLAERTALARRRSRWPLKRTVDDLGMSRVTYLEREKAGHESIVQFWEGRGFDYGPNDRP